MMIDKIFERRKNGIDDFQSSLAKLAEDNAKAERELNDLNLDLLSKNQELLNKTQNN